MNDTAIVVAALTAAMQLTIMALSVFCVGFFIGFKREEHKISEKSSVKTDITELESEREKKEKKEWKKFLSYDGSNKFEDNSF